MDHVVSSSRVIADHEVEVQFPVECVDSYLEWYLIVSHPRIIPSVKHADGVGSFDARRPSDDKPPPSPNVANHQSLQMITITMDNLTGLVNPCGEVYILASQITHITRGRLV